MRNELYIEYTRGNYLYFETNYDTCDEALKEFDDMMARMGVNMDNMLIQKLEVRRNIDGVVISKKIY